MEIDRDALMQVMQFCLHLLLGGVVIGAALAGFVTGGKSFAFVRFFRIKVKQHVVSIQLIRGLVILVGLFLGFIYTRELILGINFEELNPVPAGTTGWYTTFLLISLLVVVLPDVPMVTLNNKKS